MDINFDHGDGSGVEIVEAPHYPVAHKDIRSVRWFLAGGITGCGDWQAESGKYIRANWSRFGGSAPLTVFNSRRESFDISKKEESAKQIRWEDTMMNTSHIVSFWFCKETVQPITLLELGYCLGACQEAQHIVIGVEPGYPRALDVQIQTSLKRRNREIVIHSSLGALLEGAMYVASKVDPVYDIFD